MKAAQPPPSAAERTDLVKMAELAERSGVPAATIKHYLREGLLPEPPRRTGRTMAYYDPAVVPRIRAIKRLQRDHFLPLGVIRRVLDVTSDVDDDHTVAAAIAHVLERDRIPERRTRSELLLAGVAAHDLELLEGLELVKPSGFGPDAVFSGDDLALLRTLGAARRAGISAEMLPITILQRYIEAIRALVRIELDLFRRGVIPKAGSNLSAITEAATHLSEQLVVQIRRRLLLPTLEGAVRGAKRANARPPATSRRRGTRSRA